MRLAVLGGSTPFTIALIDQIGARLAEPGELVLHGRDRDALDLVAGYARRALVPAGWSIGAVTALEEALGGAEVVVHQVRYGGLLGRAADEGLATALGVPADETLGPAALRAGLRAAPALRRLAAAVRSRCPNALVLNLTNPLSVTTSLLAAAGVRTWGLCELPVVTQRRAATLLGCDPDAVDWAYTGLNHRGFLHHVRYGERDLVDELAGVLADRTALGVLGCEVAALDAVPLKYFGLLTGWAPHGAGRAARVSAVRAAALAELRERPQVRPPSLEGRPTPWYTEAVAPVLAALNGAGAITTVVNLSGADGVVRECRVVVDRSSCRRLPSSAPPPAARPWLARFEAHERAVLAAVADPTSRTVQAACATDPLLPANHVDEAVRRLSSVA